MKTILSAALCVFLVAQPAFANDNAKLVGTCSIQLGEWEMHPETAGDPVALTERIRKTLAEPV